MVMCQYLCVGVGNKIRIKNKGGVLSKQLIKLIIFSHLIDANIKVLLSMHQVSLPVVSDMDIIRAAIPYASRSTYHANL